MPLTHADPALRKAYAESRKKRQEEIGAFLGSLVELGILDVPDAATLARLEELAWMISSFWVPHVDVRDGTPTKRAVLDGTSTLFAIFLPYATKKALPTLTRFFANPEEAS